MRDVYIVSAARTPIGRFGGALSTLGPVDLAAHAMRAALERGDVDGAALDGYIFGQVLTAGHGQLVPRQAALKAGIPDDVDGFHVNMVCSSGMVAGMSALAFIQSGQTELMLTGGVESMSRTGFFLSQGARWGYKYLGGRTEPLVDLLAYDGLTDPMSGELMGTQTERLAREFEITRQDVDAIALASNHRAAEATASGALTAEIAPIEIAGRKGTTIVEVDEGFRQDTTEESLAALRPAFEPEGILTAGNSSQISDGAAAMVLASEDAVKAHGLSPIAKILGGVWAAGPAYRFAEAPVPGVRKLLDKTGMGLEDFDLFENNEAFAVNNIIFERQLGVPQEKLNVHGGAIALGHPIGASGSRLIVTLLGALAARGGTTGIAALCHGTGGATAMAVERVA